MGFTWQTQDSGAPDNGYSRGQHALYMRIKLAGQVIGLAQNVHYAAHTGNHPVNGIGEPGTENVPGMLYFDGSMEAFSLRKRRIPQLIYMAYKGLAGNDAKKISSISHLDFRVLPLTFEVDFSFNSAFGHPVEGGTNFEDSNESLHGVYIQDWGSQISDPNSLRMENVSFWAMGYTYNENGKVVLSMGQIPDANAPKRPAKKTH